MYTSTSPSLHPTRVATARAPATLTAPTRPKLQSIRRLANRFGHSFRLRLCLCLCLSIRLGGSCLCIGLVGLLNGCSRPLQNCQSLLGEQKREVHMRALGNAFGVAGQGRFTGVMPCKVLGGVRDLRALGNAMGVARNLRSVGALPCKGLPRGL